MIRPVISGLYTVLTVSDSVEIDYVLIPRFHLRPSVSEAGTILEYLYKSERMAQILYNTFKSVPKMR